VAAGVAFGAALGKTSSAPEAPLTALTPLRRIDGLIVGGAVVLSFAPKLLEHDLATRPPPTPAECIEGRAGVNAFDRNLRSFALGERSLEKRELLNRLSSATRTAAVVQPMALILSGDSPHKWSRDLPVWGEAALVSLAVNQAVKHLTHRRRPYARFCEPQHDSDLCAEEARLSFYSGHTSAAFVAAVAAGSIADSHRLANRRWVWASGLTLATATGVLRMAADKHYATDAIAGAAAGALSGWLIPKVHKPDPVAPTRVSRRRSGPQLAIPVALPRRRGTALISGGFTDGGPSLQLKWQW
jgi:hypothetical protein